MPRHCEVAWHSLTALAPTACPEPAGQSPRVVGLCSSRLYGLCRASSRKYYVFKVSFWGSGTLKIRDLGSLVITHSEGRGVNQRRYVCIWYVYACRGDRQGT